MSQNGGIKSENGLLPKDNNNNAIQIGSEIQNRDDTTPTPLESPQTVTGTITTIVPPGNSVSMLVRAVGNDLRYGDNTVLDGTANEGYGFIPDGSATVLPCANGKNITFKQDSANVTMYFHFEMLKRKA